jgi:hypothetical protein
MCSPGAKNGAQVALAWVFIESGLSGLKNGKKAKRFRWRTPGFKTEGEQSALHIKIHRHIQDDFQI